MPPNIEQSSQPGLPEGAIDLKQYNILIAKKAIRLQRIGPNTFQMLVKRFDPTDGVELPPAVMPVNSAGITNSIEQIEQQIKDLQESLVHLKQAKDDMDNLEASKADIGTIIGASKKS